MANKKGKSPKKGTNQTFADKRTMNAPQGNSGSQDKGGQTEGFQEQDPQRRLGSFEGTGEHARTGSRGHQ